MDFEELNYYYNKFKYGEDNFHTLMQFRVREILLISTFYDAYIFEQDGRLAEQIFGEFHQLNLTYPSRITSVPTGKAALRKLEEQSFDLVITMMRIGELSPFELGRCVKERCPDLPVLLLLNVQSDVALLDNQDLQHIDNVFLWNGDSEIFLAMIKYLEDLRNVEHDTVAGLVRVVLLVEDSIFFYSRFLPILYKEMMLQTQLLISEELNDMQKNYRMRSRPKVLMAHNFEEAIRICEQYKASLLSVISDVRFPREKQLDAEAGIRLIEYLHANNYDVPVLLQSSEERWAESARRLKVAFLHKNSASLLNDLSEFIHQNLGFGDFVFRDEHGNEIDRVTSTSDFEEKLKHIPDESLLYHSRRNHFSAWLIAHGEIGPARAIRPLHLEDFDGNVIKEREFLISIFREIRARKNKGCIINFEAQNLEQEHEIIRLSDGSLGGKGRGLAFLNALFATMEFEDRFPGVKVKIPHTAFIGTGEFDLFLNSRYLRHTISHAGSDEQIQHAFLNVPLSRELREKLRVYLEHINTPLAVRSSGLLEDSQSQSFAGVYQTFMLPNNHPDEAVRQRHLEEAIKLVYASTFLQNARSYIDRIEYRSEEEKMAVIVQEIVGSRYEKYYYPHISGVAQSYNYYPTGNISHNDGIAAIALGLGHWVVNGEKVCRFCPRYPNLQFLQPEDVVKNSQPQFLALDLQEHEIDLTGGSAATLCQLDLTDAERDGALWHLASVWDADDRRLRDGLSYHGPRVLTFANILKYKRFPLAEILAEILNIGQKAFGVPVEIEFAVNLHQDPAHELLPTFYILQIRPLLVHTENLLDESDSVQKDKLVLYTTQGMGNGMLANVRDLLYIDPDIFDNTRTLDIQRELQLLNEQMLREKCEYILIGPGRWGSRDRFLGVPVRWADISQARVIVEIGLEGFVVEASQGSHFFHNLVAMNAGYFAVPYASEKDFIDWAWLQQQKPYHSGKFLVHLRRESSPFTVKMFGKKGVAVIYK